MNTHNTHNTQSVPHFALPDDQTFERVTAEQTNDAGKNRTKLPYLKVLGPQGEASWTNLPVGYEGSAMVWLCPPINVETSPFYKYDSHFMRTSRFGKGIGFMHNGDDCRYCQRANELITTGNLPADIATKLQSWGKVRHSYLWNVILLNNLAAHQQADGSYRPFVLQAGYYLTEAIRSIILTRGVANVFDPVHGRPIKLIKKKTGYQPTDIQWSAIDLNPQPLDPQFYPVMQNMWDFKEVMTPPGDELIDGIINEYAQIQQAPQPVASHFQQQPVTIPQEVAPIATQQYQGVQRVPDTGTSGYQPQQPPVSGYQNAQTMPSVSVPNVDVLPKSSAQPTNLPPPPPVAGGDIQNLQGQIIGNK